ncbi:MAG TPA: S8 family peptidase [Pyrinomonadaceae bacterium]|nr:S8 family peptidase [Pyrinomonadaceae bacterium]
MSFVDFKVLHLQQAAPEQPSVHIVIQFEPGRLSEIEAAGFKTSSEIGDIAAGEVDLAQLPAIQNHPAVILVESSHSPKTETDVSSVAINLLNPATNHNTIPGKGLGAIIGVIDSGFELTHPSFIGPTGKTRIISCWDQGNTGGPPPAGFRYGVEYTSTLIEEKIAAKTTLPAGPTTAHGTHVAGIAAGNGTPHGIYRGMAPEAYLILVAYRSDLPLGGSAFIINAIDYIQRKAKALSLPAVINMSFGGNLGAHDGTSPLEIAIDRIVEKGRTLVVKSAGNLRGQEGEPSTFHAHASVNQNEEVAVPFNLKQTATSPVDRDTIEIWYRRDDRLTIALQPPNGPVSAYIGPGTTGPIVFPAGNRAQVFSHLHHPANGDNHIGIVLEPGEGWVPGIWNLIIRGDTVRRGDFDLWTDRPQGESNIEFQGYQSDAVTITLPGTSRNVITVGGFVSRPEERGETGAVIGGISTGSSLGPTRDGRLKPDIAAPSTLIMTPRVQIDSASVTYDFQTGTSMAAPHVTGVIALLWAIWPNLNSLKLKAALLHTARKDIFTGTMPGPIWGFGKLDAGAVYQALSTTTTGETTMSEIQQFQMEVELENSAGQNVAVTLGFDVLDGSVVGMKGIGDNGAEYNVEFVFSRTDGDECYVCLDPPCPPNRYQLVNPCPFKEIREEHRERE